MTKMRLQSLFLTVERGDFFSLKSCKYASNTTFFLNGQLISCEWKHSSRNSILWRKKRGNSGVITGEIPFDHRGWLVGEEEVLLCAVMQALLCPLTASDEMITFWPKRIYTIHHHQYAFSSTSNTFKNMSNSLVSVVVAAAMHIPAIDCADNWAPP